MSAQADCFDIRDCGRTALCSYSGVTNTEIRAALKARGMSQADLGRKLGISQTKVSLSLGGTRRWTIEEMDTIRSLLAVADYPAAAPAVRSVPIIGQVQAGNWREAVVQSGSSAPSPDPSLPPRVFGLRVAGDSMDDYVREGGVVMVDPDDKQLFPEKLYVVLNEEGEATFKQFLADPARLAPCSSNPDHVAIPIDGRSVAILGRIVWIAFRP